MIVFWLNGVEIGLLDPNIDEYNKQVEEIEKVYWTSVVKDPTINFKNKGYTESNKISASFFNQKNRTILEKIPFVPSIFILPEQRFLTM